MRQKKRLRNTQCQPSAFLRFLPAFRNLTHSPISIFLVLILFAIPFTSEAKAAKPICGDDFEIIDQLITIKPNAAYTNTSLKICVTKNGGFHVLAGGTLTLKNTKIMLINTHQIKHLGALVTLEPGSNLKIINSQIISTTNSSGKEIIEKTSGGETSRMDGVRKIIIGATSLSLGINLEISESTFTSKEQYSVGGVLIQPRTSVTTTPSGLTTETMPEMAYQKDTIPTAGVSGWIKKTKFEKIFTPIALIGAKNFEISNNKFRKNPGGNIVTSGSNISIKNNEIIFPGNGYVGDGITLYTSFKKSSISGNSITGGSCYGISFYNTEFENVTITKNHISSGITNGLYISNEYKKANTALLVTDNVFTGNSGFGIGIESWVYGVTIDSNTFIGNATDFGGYDIAVSTGAEVEIGEENISAAKIDPKWAKERKPNRTHVNEHINVFRY